MLKPTHITGALISIVVTASTPVLIGWGMDADVAAEIAAGLGSLVGIGMTLFCWVISKYSALAQPAAIVIAAVESDMPGQDGQTKKAEAVSRLKSWLDEHVSNPFTRALLKFFSEKAIDEIVGVAKRILYTPPPKVAKK